MGMTLQQLQQEGAQPGTQQAPQNWGGRMMNDISNTRQNISDAISGGGQYSGQGIPSRVTGALASAVHTPIAMAVDSLPQSGREALQGVGNVVNGVTNALSDKVSDIPALQQWASDPNHAEAVNNLSEILRTTRNVGQISGDTAAYLGVTNGLVGAKNALMNSQSVPGITQTLVQNANYDPDVANDVAQTIGRTGNAANYLAQGNPDGALMEVTNAMQGAQGTELSDLQVAAKAIQDMNTVPFSPTSFSRVGSAMGNAASTVGNVAGSALKSAAKGAGLIGGASAIGYPFARYEGWVK